MAATNKKYARPVYLVDGSRTPFLKARGKPGPFKHADLGIYASRSLLLRLPFEADAIDEVIFGSTMPGPDEANIARIVALRLGCGDQVPAYTVHRNCASGMQALDNAAMSISAGRADLVLAGGIEAMSQAPLLFHPKAVAWLADWWGAKSVGQRLKVLSRFSPRLLAPVIALLKGLTDPVVGLNMGQTAEQIAWRFGITREQMDQFALESHQKLHAAQQQGHLAEVIPIYDSDGNLYDFDDGVRPDSSLAKLAKLRPAFDKPFGMVTPGNSAQITDGAAALLLASEAAVKKHDLPVLARLVSTEWAALDPAEMGLGPAHAIAPLLKAQRLKVGDVDYWKSTKPSPRRCLRCSRRSRTRTTASSSWACARRSALFRATGSTSTAAASAWATRSAPAARASCCTWRACSNRTMRPPAWRRCASAAARAAPC